MGWLGKTASPSRRFWGVILALAFTGTAYGATLTGSRFIIEFADGDEAVAQQSIAVLDAAQREFADRLPHDGAPIRVVICADIPSFRAHAGRLAKLPLVGLARSRRGVIVVKAPYLRYQDLDYAGTLRHELVHVLLARRTDTAMLPRWLNEGLAMTLGGGLHAESMFALARMYLGDRIIPYADLDFAFIAPETGVVFNDAYAQSLSMTRFLIDRIGEETLWEIVFAMNTQTFGEALRAKAGLSPGAFYRLWLKSLWKVALITSLMSGFSVFQVAAILVFVAFWRKRRRGQRILQRWEDEEAAADGALVLPSELEGREPPYPWEEDDEESW